MIHRKLVVLASLLVGFVNIALAGVGDLDTLNVRSQAPVKERMPVIAYKSVSYTHLTLPTNSLV